MIVILVVFFVRVLYKSGLASWGISNLITLPFSLAVTVGRCHCWQNKTQRLNKIHFLQRSSLASLPLLPSAFCHWSLASPIRISSTLMSFHDLQIRHCPISDGQFPVYILKPSSNSSFCDAFLSSWRRALMTSRLFIEYFAQISLTREGRRVPGLGASILHSNPGSAFLKLYSLDKLLNFSSLKFII